MNATAMREKHDQGISGDDRMSLRVWLRLLSCTMVIEKRVRRRLADGYATTLPRFDVLAALARAPDGLTMSALSRALLVSNGNITALVQALCRSGHVALERSATDKRASIVTATAAGLAHFDALSKAHNDWIEAIFARLSPAQRVQLHELLGALKGSIAEQGDGR